jgi:hypothetical protein
MNIITGSVLVLFAAGTIGCGQSGFQSLGKATASGNQAADISTELNKAEEANAQAQAAIDEANLALKDITDSKGNINLNLFKKSSSTSTEVSSQGLLTPIIDKLRPKFEQLFSKVTVVKQKFTDARQALLTALSKIDQSNPASAAVVANIMAQLAKVDAMEKAFSASMHSLAGKLDLAISGLDKLVSGVTSFIPGFGWIANMALDFLVMSDVKDFIYEIKMRLMAL